MSAHDFGAHGAGMFLLDALQTERPAVLQRVSLSDLVHVGNAIVAKARDGMVDAATVDALTARAERAEADLAAIDATLDEIGVARSSAPITVQCTKDDTPEKYPRLTRVERIQQLHKGEEATLDRLLKADARAASLATALGEALKLLPCRHDSDDFYKAICWTCRTEKLLDAAGGKGG